MTCGYDANGQRYSDALIGPEPAAQQIAQTRRTQQVMRMMPRQPAPPKRGSGSGGGSGCHGGCNAWPNPTAAQSNSSKGQQKPQPDWGTVAKEVGLMLLGLGLLSAGLGLLATAVANPEALGAASELATDFGGSPITPIMGILTMIATGAANFTHGFFGILSQLGLISGQVAFVATLIEDTLDTFALALQATLALTSAAGLLGDLGAIQSAMAGFGAVVDDFTLLVSDVQNGSNWVNGSPSCPLDHSQPCVVG